MKVQDVDSKIEKMAGIFQSLCISQKSRIQDILNFQKYVMSAFPKELLEDVHISAGGSFGVMFTTADYMYWKEALDRNLIAPLRKIDDIKQDFFKELVKRLKESQEFVSIDDIDNLYNTMIN